VRETNVENIGSASQALVRVQLRAELRGSDCQEMLRLDRQWRAEQRQIWLARILPGVVIILGGVAGFFRVRRAPRSSARHSGLMKFAGVALVAGLLAALATAVIRTATFSAPSPPAAVQPVEPDR
jgi:hypothetical protein